MLLFALTLAALYHYAMDDSVFRDLGNLHGVMLATLFFAATIGSGRNIHTETEAGALRAALMHPADPSGYYLGKVLAIWQFQLLFLMIYIPAYQLLLTGRFSDRFADYWLPFTGLGLASLSLAALGVMLAYISRGSRMKEILFPLLLLPASLPVFILTTAFLADARDGGQGAMLTIPAILTLLAPAGLYCGLGSLLYYVMAADE